VTPGRELAVKSGAFSDTTDNLVERNAANTTVVVDKRAIVIQVRIKAFSSTILDIGFMRPQFFNYIFQVNHGLPPEDGI
jgi:hypothetical protein